VRILSIDGGGIRGLIPAIVLAEIEARAGRSAAELFDLVAGTSTGGIIACALGTGRPAADLVRLYREEGPRIFSRSLGRRVASADGLIDERYDDEALNDALRRYLGDARLADSRVPLLITAYDLHAREPVLFESGDAPMFVAARATSAAPTYFEPLLYEGRSLIDGGVYATNPALFAYARHPDARVLASLGTGKLTRRIAHEDAVGWGQLGWVRPVIDVVFDGVADSVELHLDRLLGPRHRRFQTVLDRASDDLDDASERNLRLLEEQARDLVRHRTRDLDELVRVLVDVSQRESSGHG
jgi:uncharacterized protein